MNNKDFIQLEEEDEIDLAELFFVLKKNIIAMALCSIIGAAAAFAYTISFMTPMYKSSSMIYIFTKTTSITTAADLQLGSQLTVDFEILGTSRPVLEKVIMNLGLDATYEDLLKIVEIENPEDSRIIKITVENSDAQLAADIANDIADVLADRVAQVIDTDKPSSVEDAVPAMLPYSPSKKRNTALGFIAGFLLASVFVLVRYYSDSTIKDEDDVKKYLGLGTFASFPLEATIAKDKGITNKTRKH